jgi:putative membrane protein
MHYLYYTHGPWTTHLFGWVLELLLFIGFLTALVLLIRHLVRLPPEQTPTENSTPLGILKDRYARGEIDTKEYEERAQVLNR